MTVKQHAFGVGIGSTVPLLHELLDLVPMATRRFDARPQPVRGYVTGEYITTDRDSTLSWLKGTVDALWRLRADAVWRTKVFDGVDLRASWHGEYFPDAPAVVRCVGRQANSYIELWMIYPLSGSGSSGLMIRYVDGRLAPTYALRSGAKVGVTMGLK